ncbi:MAG: LamG-like jellyroll fold domain-containing protein [Planctomycetota bacterium]|jgi:hypothetical protein
MFKKLFLLSCLLVLSLAVVATAEDINQPPFAGAAGSCAIWWDFRADSPNPDDWIYTPDLEPDFFIDDVLLEEGVWGDGEMNFPPDEEGRFYFTMPQGTGDYLSVFVQVTWSGDELFEEAWGFPEGWSAPADAGGERLGGEEWEEAEFSDVCEIDPNVFYATLTSTTNMTENPPILAFLIGGIFPPIDQIVIDAIRHPNPFPPAGPGRRVFIEPIRVSNISPADGERHAPLDPNLSFQANEDAQCIDPNADPNLKGPFEYDVYFGTEPNVLTMTQLADACQPANCNDVMVFDPCAGNLNYATKYYWRVDFNDANGAGDPCFYEGPYFKFTTIGLADNVSPADGATAVGIYDTNLAWTGDSFADDFDVYFGTDYNAVDNNSASMGNQGPNTYPLPALLLNTEYFWRIDQVNDTLTKTIRNEIWSFTTDISTEIDSMDSYTTVVPYLIADTWLDLWAKGSQSKAEILLETTPPDVQDGNSMKFNYNNAGKVAGQWRGSWTEADVANLPIGSNWTAVGGKALQIWFRGTLGNSVTSNDKMYIALDDGTTTAAVLYPDINDVNVPQWQEWNIDLQDFNDQGVNLASISKIHIGFAGALYTGQSADGGTGTVYFDNFRLFTTRCVQAEATGDATGDCIVNTADIVELQAGWLEADYEVPPEEPNRAGLMVEYLFDSDLSDTSGAPTYNGIDGDGSGTAVIVTGGYLSITQGVGDVYHVEIPLGAANPFDGSQDYTVSLEFRSGAASRPILFSTSDKDANNAADPNHQATHPISVTYELSAAGGPNPDSLTVFTDIWYVMETENTFEPGDTLINEWQHVAVTYDADGGICPDWGDEYGCPPDTVTGLLTLYVNGVPPDESLHLDPNIPEIEDANVWIGDLASPAYKSDVGFVGLTGDIDNVRIYDSALPHSNIMWLAGKADPTYFPLEEESNLYPKVGSYGYDANNVDIVNFKDFSVIADHWLEGPTLWP